MLTRAAVILTFAAALCSAAAADPSASQPACREGALVSAKSAKVLVRYSSRLGATGRRPPLLPGSDAVADGHGGWYLAGLGLAHLLHDGKLDRSWHAELQRRLAPATLQRVGARLYVSDRRRVFALDAATGRKLWASPLVVRGHGILALAANGTTVYAGGIFGLVAGQPRLGLAAFDARSGHVLPWRPPRLFFYPGSTPAVSALALTGELLYLGGEFTTVGGAPRNGAAAVRLDDGAVTAFAPNLSANDGVNAIGRLVLVGANEAGGAYDAGTGSRLKGFASLFNANAVDVHGQTAYVGGTIRSSVPVHNLLAVDLRSRTGQRRPWFPTLANYVNVSRIAASGDRVFVGGDFCSSLG
jgi:outer membrane protein assembly factor BamB